MHSQTVVKILQTGSTFADTHSAPYVEAYHQHRICFNVND